MNFDQFLVEQIKHLNIVVGIFNKLTIRLCPLNFQRSHRSFFKVEVSAVNKIKVGAKMNFSSSWRRQKNI